MKYRHWCLVFFAFYGVLNIQSVTATTPSSFIVNQSIDFNSAERELKELRLQRQFDPQEALALSFQLAALYQLYSRVDLLQNLLSEIKPAVFSQNNSSLQARWYYHQAFCDYYSSQYALADRQLQGAIALLKQESLTLNSFENVYLIQQVYLLQGLNLVYLQQYDQAISVLTNVYEVANKNKWQELQGQSLYYLGDTQYELKNYESALDFYQRAKSTFSEQSKVSQALSRLAIAQMINVVGDKVEALVLIDEVIELNKQQQNLPSLAFAYLLKSYFIQKQRPEEALTYIAQSVALREKLGVGVDIANAYVHYANVLSNNNKLDKALVYALKAVDLTEKSEDLSGKWDAYNVYAKLLNEKQQYKEAFEYMSKAERTLLKKARLDITSEAARLSIQFDVRQQQLQNQFVEQQKMVLEERNALLESQVMLQTDIQKTQGWVLILLGLLLLFSLLFILLIYRLYFKTKLLASRDALTGLLNRRSILAIAHREFESSMRHQFGFSVLMLDIDNFKFINDNYGHEVGDITLKQTATTCLELLRKTDYLGRIGGEEFLFVLPHTQQTEALNLAERIRQAIKDAFMQQQGPVNEVTVSIGVSEKTGFEPTTLDEIIHQADKALYEAKNSGRNRVELFVEGQVQFTMS